MAIRKAVRTNTPVKVALEGPSGSGKTMSALLMAYGLCDDWDRVCLIDTENKSGSLYADYRSDKVQIGAYSVIDLDPDYTPQKYINAIHEAERAGMKVLVVDSLSHAWAGTGGILEIHDKKAGNSFANWREVTPMHNALVNAILQSPLDIICTMRTKTEYVLDEETNGQGRTTTKPRKVGMKSIQRDGIDYEFTTVFDINHMHMAEPSKDRTGLFDGRVFTITPATGAELREWRMSGKAVTLVAPAPSQPATKPTSAPLVDEGAIIRRMAVEEPGAVEALASTPEGKAVVDAALSETSLVDILTVLRECATGADIVAWDRQVMDGAYTNEQKAALRQGRAQRVGELEAKRKGGAA